MSAVRAASEFPGTVHEAECCWCDASRWPAWVDGCDRVLETTPDWPDRGSSVIWESGPAGRGRVSERVLGHEPLQGVTTHVSDDSINATQSVAFTPVDGGVEVVLKLDYEISKRSIVTPLVDLLFIRRAMERSITTTLDAVRRTARGAAGNSCRGLDWTG